MRRRSLSKRKLVLIVGVLVLARAVLLAFELRGGLRSLSTRPPSVDPISQDPS
jgi:hypothetical protein